MARDNSPQIRQKQQLERKQNNRNSHDRILIVSEGSKTEPNYFNEIRKEHQLNTASIVVLSSATGTAPIQVVEYAKELFEKGDSHKKIRPKSFEKIYAVFDRDNHRSYFEALDLAESFDGQLKNDAKQKVSFQAVASIPSFELWLLLHYEDIFAPICRNDVIHRLKQHIPGYSKGADDMFKRTKADLSDAIQRAEGLVARNFNERTDPEPFTGIYNLVNLLIAIGSVAKK